MRTCPRCRGETPGGLRFCNDCGARLRAPRPIRALGGERQEALVFGNLAREPEARPSFEPQVRAAPEADARARREASPYRPPRHLRALPDPEPRRLGRAQEIAADLALKLPSSARTLADRAGRVARQVGEGASQVARSFVDSVRSTPPPRRPLDSPWETQYPAGVGGSSAPVTPRAGAARDLPDPHARAPSPRPPPTSPPPQASRPEVPDLPDPTPPARARREAAPSAPDLRRAYALYQEGRAAYERGDRAGAVERFTRALDASPPGSPLASFLLRVLKPKASPPGAASSGPVGAGARSLAAPGPSARAPSRRGHLRVVPPSASRGRASEPTSPTPDEDLAVRAEARAQARTHWMGGLPEEGPRRPSALLDAVQPRRHVELLATGALGLALLAFLTLLVL